MNIPRYRDGEVLVRLKDRYANLNRSVIRRYQLPDQNEILRLRLPQGTSVEQALTELRQDPRVLYAASNDILTSSEQVPDDLNPSLWGMRAISAPQAWSQTTGSRQGPVVAVVDGGVDYQHPDLAENIWSNPGEIPGNGLDDDGNGVVDDVHGFNAVQKSGDPMDDSGHGTHCAGTVGAVGNNGQGVVGVNWQAQIMPVKFLDKGWGDTAEAIEGILYASAAGARITSNSWGGPNYNQALYDALKSSPALHICAAGNDGSNTDISPAYPAAYDLPNVVAVAASDRDNQIAGFSNYGVGSVHLAAPGVGIYSTLPAGQFGEKSGTSMACPHVSGVAALIASRYPKAGNQEIKDRLLYSVDRLPQWQDKVISGGRLNAASALEDDRLPPGAVTQLSSQSPTTEGFQLTWKASGDDHTEGRTAAYEVRYSPAPIDDSNFAQALPVRTLPPQAAGSAETLAVRLRPSAQQRQIHVAVQAIDNVGQRSPLTQTAVTVPPALLAFEDDGESGTARWTAQGKWGLESVDGRGQVWSDSPGGEYGLGQNATLTSQVFSLQGLQSARLSFDCRHDLEINFDKVFLEASPDGQNWNPLDSFNLLRGWEEKSYDLAAYLGGPLQLRFRLKTDEDVCKDGFQFDNLVIVGEK